MRKSIAVDFGGTSIKIGVTRGAEILEKAASLSTASYDSPDAIIRAMCSTARDLLHRHADVEAVGLGMPGWTDFHRGVLYQLTNVPVWDHEVPVRDIMQQELNLPVVLDNDANCMAYAEWQQGAGVGLESLVCLTLGTGIGGGIVVHNRMLRGRTVSAAELGQTSVDWRGRTGPFGNRGAIEEYIGNNEFAADAARAYAEAGISRSIEDCAPHLLEKSAREGCRIAKAMYTGFAEKLATLIMNLMYTFVPEAVIIGGGVSRAGDLLFEPLDVFLRQQLFPVHYAALQLKPAYFGADAGLVGAGLMAQDYVAGELK